MAGGYEGKSFFSERLMRKKPDVKELALSLLTALSAGVICALSIVYLGTVALIIWAAAIYGAYYIISGLLFKEYEYILTDSTLDIDIITAKRSRKRLKSIEIKECTEGGRVKGEKKGELLCPTENSENLYYLERQKSGVKETVIIDPNPMMIDAFKYYMGKSFEE